MATTRIHPSRAQRDCFSALQKLSTTVGSAASDAGLDERLVELVQLRASQINGCAYCLDVHSERARSLGETEQRIALLTSWRDAALFSPKERAGLELAEAVTLIHDGNLPDEVYDRATLVLDEAEYSALLWVLVSINAFNRLAVSGRYPVKPRA